MKLKITEDKEDDFEIDSSIVIFQKKEGKILDAWRSLRLWLFGSCLGSVTAIIDGKNIIMSIPMFGFTGEDRNIYEIIKVSELDEWRKKIKLYDESKKDL